MTDELHDNTLLAKLPRAELELLTPRLELLDLQLRHDVYQPRRPIEHVYFPLTSVFSMVASTPDDRTGVEVGTIGYEGFVGLPLFLGSSVSPHAAFCQVPGQAFACPRISYFGSRVTAGRCTTCSIATPRRTSTRLRSRRPAAVRTPSTSAAPAGC